MEKQEILVKNACIRMKSVLKSALQGFLQDERAQERLISSRPVRFEHLEHSNGVCNCPELGEMIYQICQPRLSLAHQVVYVPLKMSHSDSDSKTQYYIARVQLMEGMEPEVMPTKHSTQQFTEVASNINADHRQVDGYAQHVNPHPPCVTASTTQHPQQHHVMDNSICSRISDLPCQIGDSKCTDLPVDANARGVASKAAHRLRRLSENSANYRNASTQTDAFVYSDAVLRPTKSLGGNDSIMEVSLPIGAPYRHSTSGLNEPSRQIFVSSTNMRKDDPLSLSREDCGDIKRSELLEPSRCDTRNEDSYLDPNLRLVSMERRQIFYLVMKCIERGLSAAEIVNILKEMRRFRVAVSSDREKNSSNLPTETIAAPSSCAEATMDKCQPSEAEMQAPFHYLRLNSSPRQSSDDEDDQAQHSFERYHEECDNPPLADEGNWNSQTLPLLSLLKQYIASPSKETSSSSSCKSISKE